MQSSAPVLMPHFTAASGAATSTLGHDAPFAQVKLHDCDDAHVTAFVHAPPPEHAMLHWAAVHVMAPVQAPPPEQVTVHDVPPQLMGPVHEPPPVHWRSHEVALVQSAPPVQSPPPHWMTQAWPAGHVGVLQPPVFELLQSIVQMLPAPHFPPAVAHAALQIGAASTVLPASTEPPSLASAAAAPSPAPPSTTTPTAPSPSPAGASPTV